MFAVLKTGGKQYRVTPGDSLAFGSSEFTTAISAVDQIHLPRALWVLLGAVRTIRSGRRSRDR